MADNTTHSSNSYYAFTLGGTAYQPYSSSNAGSNKDLLSKFVPSLGNTSGAIGSTVKPILYTYLEITTLSSGTGGTSDGNYHLQLATSSSGSGGVNDATEYGSYGAKSFNPNMTSFTGSTVYYGFYITTNSGTVNFYREGSTDTTRNPDGIYTDGTLTSTGTPNWNTTAIYGKIRYTSVPNAPGTPTVLSKTPKSITVSFSEPTDNGGQTINSYRALVSTDGSTWYSTGELYDSSIVSGTINLEINGYYANASDSIPTPLNPNTTYYIKVAALNGVSDAHITSPYGYNDWASHTGTNSVSSAAIITPSYGQRFTGTTSADKTAITNVSIRTGSSADSVIVNGVTYTGWRSITTIKKWNGTSWQDLTGA
jgi:hypothetical protein